MEFVNKPFWFRKKQLNENQFITSRKCERLNWNYAKNNTHKNRYIKYSISCLKETTKTLKIIIKDNLKNNIKELPIGIGIWMESLSDLVFRSANSCIIGNSLLYRNASTSSFSAVVLDLGTWKRKVGKGN